MTEPFHLSAADRTEMIRAHTGLVTALIDGDDRALRMQLRGLVDDQWQASGGDVDVFRRRMSKHIEAGARSTWHVMMSLAPRLGLTTAETQQIIAQIYSGDFEDQLPE